jgi:hypothetical protein
MERPYGKSSIIGYQQMTTITAGTSLGSGLVYDSDTTGNLVIKTGSSATTVATFHGNSAVVFTGEVYLPGSSVSLRASLGVGTANTSVSGGTVIAHTGIPTWARRITIMYSGLSTNGVNPVIIQVGAGTIKTTGYLGAAAVIEGGTGYTVGFGIGNSNVNGADVQHGTIVLNLLDSGTNTWVASGTAARSDGVEVGLTGGAVALSGALDRIQITTTTGTDQFDAGMTNIMWE